MFAILVMMALFTTFLTTPILMAIYRPDRHLSSHSAHTPNKTSLESHLGGDELLILACIRGPKELPSLTALINLQCCSTKPSTTKVYMMRLLEMTHRPSSIATVQRTRRNGLPCIARFCPGEFDQQVAAAFKACNKREKVKLRPATSVSTLPMMDKDICHIAEKKRAAMMILPFHKQWKREDGEDVEINLGQGWRGVNERVLANAPCSVSLLVDRGFCSGDERVRRVCIPFLGGPDSRAALELGSRIADHPGTRVTVIKFCRPDREKRAQPSSRQALEIEDQGRDETSLAEFRQKWDGTVRFIENETTNIAKELLGVAESAEFELIVVGKGRFRPAVAAAAAEMANQQQVEYEELGQIGGLLASSRHRITTSLLVVQHHHSTHEAP